ncbi:hypothetical protein HYALB_00012380 [Hymenoscyphus albidus]|uniref:Uncharacterized protein n=1 Tax=Hymenoscyphus albidus TaxID=595503 RepID=A0A9N9LTI7_9HELO|nr:hypothetical protein HYALB_00012380 [Hymenoscyphus albidus]
MQFINLPTALLLLASALSVTAAPIQNEVALEARDPLGVNVIKNSISTTIFKPKEKLHARDELEARVWPKILGPSSPKSPKSPKSPVPGSPRWHKRTLTSEYFAKDPNEVEQNTDADGWIS